MEKRGEGIERRRRRRGELQTEGEMEPYSKAPVLRKRWPKPPRRPRPQLPCRCRRSAAWKRFKGGRVWVLDHTVAGSRPTSAEAAKHFSV